VLIQLTPLHEILSRWNKQQAVPLQIPFLDKSLGGLLPYHLQIIIGESGVGKTWFCINAIHKLLKQEPDAQVLYTDFGGNFRIKNLRKLLSHPNTQLDQITVFQTTTLLDQIVFFRNLLEKSECSYDLIVLDSVFGPPLTCFEYFHTNSKFWNKRIFAHLLDLQTIARQIKIPILLTNHLISSRENFQLRPSLNQYGGDLIELFAPIVFLLQKIDQKQFIELRIFKETLGQSDLLLPEVGS
jgi:predicted ATP-dependent serine protease